MESFLTNILLPAGLILIPVSFVLMVLGLFWGMASNPKGAVKSIIGIAVMIVIFLLAYATADGSNNSAITTSVGTIKLIQAGLVTFTVLLGVTVLAMIGSAVRDLIK